MMLLVNLFAIAIAWTSVQGNNQREKLFLLQKSKDNETLLVVTWAETEDEISPGCEFFSDRDLINEVLLSSNDSPIRTISENEMQNLHEECSQFDLRRKKREDSNGRTTISSDNIDDPEELFRRRSNRRRGSQNTVAKNTEGKSDAETTTQRSTNSWNRRTNNSGGSGRTRSNGEVTTNGRRSGSSNRGTNNREIERTTETTNGRRRNSTNRNATNREVEGPPRVRTTTATTTTTEPTTTLGYDGLPVIFPGTKWCGAGAVAENYADLGRYDDTDKCCRAHDLCNDTMAPGETRNNLTNTSSFTKLSCECDDVFYDCLDRVDSIPANTIGNMYFNILRRDCYAYDYPPSNKCKKYLTLLKLTCLEYEKDTKAKKVYQWVNPKRFRTLT